MTNYSKLSITDDGLIISCSKLSQKCQNINIKKREISNKILKTSPLEIFAFVGLFGLFRSGRVLQ